MDLIVLVKYVADVENIPEDAWDTERGTLRRHLLQMVANPLDDRALELGLDMRRRRCRAPLGAPASVSASASAPASARHAPLPSGPVDNTERVIVLSMGPPQAEEICRRALAAGADDAVLLSDTAFSGADTIATARTIAAAIKKLIAEGRVRDPLILAGMQSPDGDTAQVPVQVAALLEIPLVPYVAAWRETGDGDTLLFETLQPRGRGELVLKHTPALLTVTKFAPELPFHTTMERMIAAGDAAITIWGRADLALPENEVGLAGSCTRVVRIFSPENQERGSYRVEFGGERDPLEELPVVLAKLEDFLHTGAEARVDAEAEADHHDGVLVPGDRSADGPTEEPHTVQTWYPGECMVLCEREDGRISECSRELLGRSTVLAQELGTRTTAVVVGTVTGDERRELARAGADHVVSIKIDLPEVFIPEGQARAITQVVRKRRPQVFLLPATLTGRVIAPLVAAELGAGLTADCTGLETGDYVGRVGGRRTTFHKVLFQTRPALGGNIMATIVALRGRENDSPQMATARPGVFTAVARDKATATVEEFFPVDRRGRAGAVTAVDSATRAAASAANAASEPSDEVVPLDECEVIVSVGIGIGSAANVDKLARPLVRALRDAWGVNVGLACSRAAMEAGFMPHSAQVGQTGKTVKPRIYIALGISGAVQHRVGMEKAGRIVSINSDADAPLFSFSDYVIRAGCEEAIPVLLKLLARKEESTG